MCRRKSGVGDTVVQRARELQALHGAGWLPAYETRTNGPVYNSTPTGAAEVCWWKVSVFQSNVSVPLEVCPVFQRLPMRRRE